MKNPDKNTIFKYVRARRGSRVGLVLATKLENGSVCLGWSLCATKLGDEFNSDYAFKIAFGRAHSLGGVDSVPRSVAKDYTIIMERASRYFNDDPTRDYDYGIILAKPVP